MAGHPRTGLARCRDDPVRARDAAESRTIEIKFPNGAWKFTAVAYITDFVLPNFYFHSSIVYALLRKSGVEIGKSDFLGAIQ